MKRVRCTEDELAELYRTRAGWILPEGRLLVAAGLHQHLDALVGTEYAELLKAMNAEIESIQIQISDIMYDDEDDHPAWHRFDGWAEEPRDRLVRDLYGIGLVRLGIGLDRSVRIDRSNVSRMLADPASNILEAEGIAEHVDTFEFGFQKIARKLGTALMRVRYEVVDRDRKGRPVDPHLARIVDDEPSLTPKF